jgi:ribosomal protein S27E
MTEDYESDFTSGTCPACGRTIYTESACVTTCHHCGWTDAVREEVDGEALEVDLLAALKAIKCSDCKDGVLLTDSLLFDLDREGGKQPCPNCAIRLAAIAAAEGADHV